MYTNPLIHLKTSEGMTENPIVYGPGPPANTPPGIWLAKCRVTVEHRVQPFPRLKLAMDTPHFMATIQIAESITLERNRVVIG